MRQRRPESRSPARWLKRLALALLVVLLLLVAIACWLLRGSLPMLDGSLSLPGLSAPVTIQRDRLGVVTVDAANETDAMRALGYVHAQERFFEMDLMRRTAAGELAELFGPIAVETDKQHRLHRMRARVAQELPAIAGEKMDVLKAYVEGVNAGLADLKVRPWPYLLLRTEPKPWLLADTPLVGYAMYFDLQDSTNERELALWKIKRVVPSALFALLARDGTHWDAPLMGQPRDDAMLPEAATLDLRKLAMPRQARAFTGLVPPSREIGSNNFAISGALTRDGRAIVADDMHLGLRVPNIWFRARLRYADTQAIDGKVDVSGFTLPGLPLVVVGSNRHVAWGFTNSYADVADWAIFAPCSNAKHPPPDPAVSTCSPTRHHHERIAVSGHQDVDLDVEENFWGPIIRRDAHGDAFALRWTAQLPGSLNLGLTRLSTASNVDVAIADAGVAAIPAQNLAMADSDGNIAWRILGPLPKRDSGCQGVAPGPVHDMLAPSAIMLPDRDCREWQVTSSTVAVMRKIPAGRLWTANNRTLDDEALQQIGDAGYALGARAQQIRDDLFARQQFSERDLLAIQLDDRALFLQRWWLLLRVETARAKSPALVALADAANTWQNRASTNSVSYRIVRAWRLAVHARLLDGLTAPAQAALGEEFLMPDLPQFEGVAWPLVTQHPDHLLPRRFASWDALFEDAALEVRVELLKQGALAQRTWGERNTARICHPLAMALPGFARRVLCMPFDPLNGDVNMPRVAAPAFGASERMVVSPGHEVDGFIQMPGGQSGHPLSPFWGAGHEDWVHGRPTPFLPGKTAYTLRMTPAK